MLCNNGHLSCQLLRHQHGWKLKAGTNAARAFFKNSTQYESLPSRWVRALLLHQWPPVGRPMPKLVQLNVKSFQKCLNGTEFGQICDKFLVTKCVQPHFGVFFQILLNRVQEKQSVFFPYEFLHWYYFHTLLFWKSSVQQLPLALNFISCQRVFDNMNGDTVWHILEIYRLRFKGVWILKDFGREENVHSPVLLLPLFPSHCADSTCSAAAS